MTEYMAKRDLVDVDALVMHFAVVEPVVEILALRAVVPVCVCVCVSVCVRIHMYIIHTHTHTHTHLTNAFGRHGR